MRRGDKRPALPPRPEQHRIAAAEWKRPVDLGDLREITEGGERQAAQVDRARRDRFFADQRLQQGRFTRAIGPDDRRHAAGLEHPADMMHRGVPVVGQSQILEPDRSPHGRLTAHQIASQSRTRKVDAATTRTQADWAMSESVSGSGWGCA